MSGYVSKPRNADQVCLVDWRKGYLLPRETIVDDLGWRIQHADGLRTCLNITEQHHDFYATWASFRGGISGRFYHVSSHIRTSRDRLLERSIVMRIAAGDSCK